MIGTKFVFYLDCHIYMYNVMYVTYDDWFFNEILKAIVRPGKETSHLPDTHAQWPSCCNYWHKSTHMYDDLLCLITTVMSAGHLGSPYMFSDSLRSIAVHTNICQPHISSVEAQVAHTLPNAAASIMVVRMHMSLHARWNYGLHRNQLHGLWMDRLLQQTFTPGMSFNCKDS